MGSAVLMSKLRNYFIVDYIVCSSPFDELLISNCQQDSACDISVTFESSQTNQPYLF